MDRVTRRLSLPKILLTSAMAAALTAAVCGPSPASGSAATIARPTVVSLSTAPADLASSGGTVEVTSRVAGAQSCRLELLSSQSFPVVYSHNPTAACRRGSYAAHLVIGPNPTPVTRTVAFALLVSKGASSAERRFSVTLGAFLPPQVVSLRTSPSQVPPAGGKVTLTASLTHASVCRLVLLSRQSFPVVYASNSRACGPVLSAHITLGANPTPLERTVAFELLVQNGANRSSARFYLALSARSQATTTPGPVPTTPPPAPATTTTVPAKTTTTTAPTTTTTSPGPAAQQVISENWSGYAVTGGPFASVSGTFTVPYVATSAGCDARVAEWVGVDGFDPTPQQSSGNLIQAGIDEGETDPTTGQCTPGQFHLWPWWEVLPAPEQVPSNWNGPAVSAGDTVTVTVQQVTGATWEISLNDLTSGGSFTQETSYSGPGSTAEWVVEAPANEQLCSQGQAGGDTCPLAPYTDASGGQPGVTFSSTAETGSVGTWYELTMEQGGQVVSAPSPLSTAAGGNPTGFSVSYAGTAGSGAQTGDAMAPGDQAKGRTGALKWPDYSAGGG
ncbi:MAG TPA: G1 family glutamic endopeptidase [Acidimicrobiales bacterium]|nr:G1 family glutamic endopeptidase [Acidimicrobiales bacterium]